MSPLVAFVVVAATVVILGRLGFLLYRYAPRVGAVIAAATLLPTTFRGEVLESLVISTMGSLVATGLAWNTFLRPDKLPLVWYVTFWASVIGSTVAGLVVEPWLRGTPIPYAISVGLVRGIEIGSAAGLLTFAIRGPVHDPADDEPPGCQAQLRSIGSSVQRFTILVAAGLTRKPRPAEVEPSAQRRWSRSEEPAPSAARGRARLVRPKGRGRALLIWRPSEPALSAAKGRSG